MRDQKFSYNVGTDFFIDFEKKMRPYYTKPHLTVLLRSWDTYVHYADQSTQTFVDLYDLERNWTEGSETRHLGYTMKHRGSTYGKRQHQNNFDVIVHEYQPPRLEIGWEGYLIATNVSLRPSEVVLDGTDTYYGSAAAHIKLDLTVTPDNVEDFAFVEESDYNPYEMNQDAYILDIAKKLNPSRPHVDVPTFVFELREMPALLKQTHNALKEGIDPFSAHLAKEFGVDPLKDDLRKILNFVSAVEKRLKAIKRMAAGKTITRSNKDWPDIAVHEYVRPLTFTVNGNSHTISIVERREYTRWVSLHYKYDEQSIPLDYEDQYELAKKVTFGTSLNGESLWNAFPWSWLIDWFQTTGDHIAAKRNTIGATIDKVCLMETVVRTIHVLERSVPLEELDFKSLLPQLVPNGTNWEYQDEDTVFSQWPLPTNHANVFGSLKIESKSRTVMELPEGGDRATMTEKKILPDDTWRASILGALLLQGKFERFIASTWRG